MLSGLYILYTSIRHKLETAACYFTGYVVCGDKYLVKCYKFKIYVNQQEFDSDCVFSWRVNKNHNTLHKASCFFFQKNQIKECISVTQYTLIIVS